MTKASQDNMIRPDTSPLASKWQQSLILGLKSARRIKRLFAPQHPPKQRPSALIFPQQKKAMLVIPKVASRTLLSGFGPDEIAGTLLNMEGLLDFETTCAGYELAYVVRDPSVRAISCFDDKIARLDKNYARASRIARYQYLQPFLTLKEFSVWLNSEEGGDQFADVHWLSQHVLASTFIGEPHNVRFFKLEEMDQMFSEIWQWLEIEPRALPRINVAAPTETRDRLDADPQILALLNRRYAVDLQTYGYAP